MMGTHNNLSLLKTHFDSIKACFVNHSVPGNMLWVFTPLRVFICNYVLYSFGLIVQFILRIGRADGKNELSAQTEENCQIDGFREEMINFMFPRNEYVSKGGGETEMKWSVLMESVNDFAEDDIKETADEETESSVSEKSGDEETGDTHTKIESEFNDGGVKNNKEGEEDSILIEDEQEKEEIGNSATLEGEEIERGEEEELECPALITNKFEYVSGRDIIGFIEEPTTTLSFSFREFFVGPYVSSTEISEHNSEQEKSDGAQGFGEFHLSSNGSQVEFSEVKSDNEPVFQEEQQKEISELKSEEEKSIGAESFPEFHRSPNGSEVETSELKSEHKPVFREESQKEVSELTSEEEKSFGAQSFPEFHPSLNGSEVEISEVVSDQQPVFQQESALEQSMTSFHSSPNVSETGISETKSEEEKEGSQQRMFQYHSSSDQFSLKSEIFHGRDSSDEDDLDFNDNSFESDSESESSSSSGLIWGNSDRTDDVITYEFLAYQKGFEVLGPETLKLMEKLRAIDEFIELAPGKAGNEDQKEGSKDEQKKLGELVSEEEEDDEEDDFEWDDDELVEQMKSEMRNARQGGLPTILEDEEEQEEEGQEDSESPKLVEDLKPLKMEERLEFKDHIREIQKVHKSYEEKMRKLDILNYQTMHALGLRQLKESSGKPMILKSLLWSRKDHQKKKSLSSEAPLVGLVEELEVVYVGQLCLSWEILCWEYTKATELRHYDREWVRRYNVVAGEFQLFQVLMQRFIENEPFQGPRLQNYVRNRCVIRNLLQVPAIQDDSKRDKNMVTKDEEDAISIERLAEIIRESMYIFSKFARADKHDISGSTFFKLPHQSKPTHLKDPATSHLFTDIQTHLLKKEKRLKDIVRSGNCIVRKFQKQSEHKVELDLEQMMAQVQLKLISRVLSMSKLRKDQLIWCSDKLNRITFVDTKVRVEPSFLLFPF